MRLSILIPTFNEERTVEEVVRCLLRVPFPIETEILLVDDRSEDKTFSIEQRLKAQAGPIPIRVFQNPLHQGKGGCLRLGLESCTGDWVIVQDADLEYNPQEIPQLLQPLLQGTAQAVYGSRFLFRCWPRGMRWPHFIANRLLTRVANCLFGSNLTDAYSCYKVIPRALLQNPPLETLGFESEAEIIAKLANHKVKIAEIPVSFQGRNRKEGKKIRAMDLVKGIQTLWRYRPSRL